jgi:hypothetical protein
LTATVEETTDNEIGQDEWTMQNLIDELYISLMRHDLLTDAGDGIKKSKYEKQAQELMFRIPVYQPVPSFIVNINDLDDRLKKELTSLDYNSLTVVLNESIARIFENLNERYFKLSVKKLLKCELKR